MGTERELTVDLGEDGKIVVYAESVGPQLVADDKVTAVLSEVVGPIERIAREVLDAVKRAAPTKATVEVGFGLAIEQGHLVAAIAKGKGEATIKVTLEWSKAADGA